MVNRQYNAGNLELFGPTRDREGNWMAIVLQNTCTDIFHVQGAMRGTFIGASLSEPHTDVVTWDSVTRDIYIYTRGMQGIVGRA